jgi:hypothetical protein
VSYNVNSRTTHNFCYQLQYLSVAGERLANHVAQQQEEHSVEAATDETHDEARSRGFRRLLWLFGTNEIADSDSGST